jgi:Glycosyltransferase family 87
VTSQLQPETLAQRAASWLTLRRIRAHAILLALCLWGVCALDFSTPGLFDHVGNIKFQDFLPFYVSGRLITQGRADQLYNQQVSVNEMRQIVHLSVRLPFLYPPQVGLFFMPLARLTFPAAARIWVALSLLIYFACIYLAWRSCPSLRPYPGIVGLAAIAFPPLFHFFVRGQISVPLVLCFTAAFLAFHADQNWLAGIALGFLIFKPQFIVAIPLILLLSGAWSAFAALILSAAAQLAFARIHFGSTVMLTCFDTFWHASRWIGTAEPGQAQIQMHSLRSFWQLLIPWPEIAGPLYIFSSVVVVAIATATWKSSRPLALRFSALVLASVLVNPHLFVYDLLVLAPILLLLTDWALSNAAHSSTPALRVLLYLAFTLPLLGPLSRWTHIQLSVPALVALLWIISSTQVASRPAVQPGQSPAQL